MMANHIRHSIARKATIPVTRPMILAATRVLNESGAVDYPTLSHSSLVEEMLVAAFLEAGYAVKNRRVCSQDR